MDQRIIDKLKVITPEEQEILDGKTEVNVALYKSGNELDEIDSRALLEAGKLITIRPNTRFIHFPAHHHNYIEVMYMVSGSTTHIVDGHRIKLHTGELLFLNQNAVQEILPAAEDDIGVNFIILPEFFQYALSMLSGSENLLRSFLIDCMAGQRSDVGYLHFKVADSLPIQNLVENLIWSLLMHESNRRSINELTMGLLLLQLVKHIDENELILANEDQSVILQVLSYIDTEYRDGELSVLADNLHYDVATLSRMIKHATGANFTDLMQERRLSEAASQLESTTKSVAEIAGEVGYENLSYFHRIFQKRYGMTPRKYRIHEKS